MARRRASKHTEGRFSPTASGIGKAFLTRRNDETQNTYDDRVRRLNLLVGALAPILTLVGTVTSGCVGSSQRRSEGRNAEVGFPKTCRSFALWRLVTRVGTPRCNAVGGLSRLTYNSWENYMDTSEIIQTIDAEIARLEKKPKSF
jgi:hypothetical protein